MDKIKIKKGGSIHQLATLFDRDGLPNNLCSLFWTCLFNLGIISLLCCLVGLILGDLLGGLAGLLMTQTFQWTFCFAIIAGVSTVMLAFLAVALVVTLFTRVDEDSNDPVSKTIYNIKFAYKSWKDKFCPLVEEE